MIDQSLLHPNEVGPKDLPRFQITICPEAHSMTYYPADGPPMPGFCMVCASLVITILIPLSFLSRYGDLSKNLYRKAEAKFSVVT